MIGLQHDRATEPRDVPDWMRDAFNAPPTAEEAAEYERQEAQRRELTEIHPAVTAARRYLAHVWDIDKALRELPIADPTIGLAWESIRTLAWTISAKSARAIHEVVDRSLGDEWDDRTLDPRGVMTDGNGSAKVTLIIIRESREAWVMLACFDPQFRRRATDAVGWLDTLDGELRSAFPYAMEFVRPGFDDQPTGAS